MKNIVIGSMFAVAMLYLGAPARADLLADIRAKGEIVAATEMHYAPFDMMDDNNKYIGIDRDLFDAIAKELGVKVTYLDIPWEGIPPGLAARKFDFACTAMTITAERMKRFAFTLPIGDGSLALVKHTGDASISKPEDMAGKIIGSEKGSSELAMLKQYSKTLAKPVDARGYLNLADAMADLGTGRLDGVANGLPQMAYAAVQRPEVFELVTPTFGDALYYAFATRAGDETKSLIQAVNAALLKMHQDGRLEVIYKKWLGVMPQLPTTMPEVR